MVVAFSGFTLLVTTVFGLYTVVFMYTVEDSVFNARLQREAQLQQEHLQHHGSWTQPADARVQVYRDPTTLPSDLRTAMQHEPWRSEFSGENGRHYHVRHLDDATAGQAWLVSEVSDELVVRPVRDQVLILLAVTGLLMVLLAIVLGVWLARRGTRELYALVQRVEALPLQAKAEPSLAQGLTDEEIAVLAQALDRLHARVAAFIEREASFTRDASHELRTPLTVISTAAGQLLQEPTLSMRGRQHVQHIQGSALQLQQAVAALLALAREEVPAIACDAVRLLPLLERVIIEQAPLLEGREVEVALDVGAAATLRAPEPILRLVLSNLIGNAFAHSPHGTIRIGIQDAALQVDNPAAAGADLQAWPAPRPFEKHSDSSGTGLGLHIMRRLCDQHGLQLQIHHMAGTVQARLQGVAWPSPPVR